jgi:hypothetical protein
MRRLKPMGLALIFLVAIGFTAFQSSAGDPVFEPLREVSGKVYIGPESIYFHSCDDAEDGLWLDEGTGSADGWKDVLQVLNSQPECSLSTTPCTYQEASVSGIAEISNIGTYGHLGAYERTIKFLSITPIDEPEKCKSHKS